MVRKIEGNDDESEEQEDGEPDAIADHLERVRDLLHDGPEGENEAAADD